MTLPWIPAKSWACPQERRSAFFRCLAAPCVWQFPGTLLAVDVYPYRECSNSIVCIHDPLQVDEHLLKNPQTAMGAIHFRNLTDQVRQTEVIRWDKLWDKLWDKTVGQTVRQTVRQTEVKPWDNRETNCKTNWGDQVRQTVRQTVGQTVRQLWDKLRWPGETNCETNCGTKSETKCETIWGDQVRQYCQVWKEGTRKWILW